MLVALADGIELQWLLDPENTNMLEIFDGFYAFISGATNVGETVGSDLNGSKAPEHLSSE